MSHHLKHIDLADSPVKSVEVVSDIISNDEKQFLDLLSSMMFQGIINQVKTMQNEK